MWSGISSWKTATFEDPVDFRSYRLHLFNHKIKLPLGCLNLVLGSVAPARASFLHVVLYNGTHAGVFRFTLRCASGRDGDTDLRDSDLQVITNRFNIQGVFFSRHTLLHLQEQVYHIRK